MIYIPFIIHISYMVKIIYLFLKRISLLLFICYHLLLVEIIIMLLEDNNAGSIYIDKRLIMKIYANETYILSN